MIIDDEKRRKNFIEQLELYKVIATNKSKSTYLKNGNNKNLVDKKKPNSNDNYDSVLKEEIKKITIEEENERTK